MSDYTPDIDTLRDYYVGQRYYYESCAGRKPPGIVDRFAEFDRAVANIRAEAKVEALNETADQVSSIDGREDHAARDWLRVRAERYKDES